MQNEKQTIFRNPQLMPPANGYTQVVEVRNGRTIYVSGQVAMNQNGELVGPGDLAAQTRQVFENIKAALESSGVSFNDVVKLTFFVTDIAQMQIVRDIRDSYVNTKNPPASSAVEVSKLVNEHFLIEIEAIAVGE
ncbi:RidA family protein [Paenibacillus oleatilyticus]|uniref:RidA family protein n=1 Tax=Paenibacillus oleatilyticus TaxID=2594886 RepID=UPI001C1FB19D|nr:RidA family protein [Paenibacillus oleatilyticus]MBU7317181.1 RidA family protein [Paenibacillus oleatilyticus]